MSYQMHRVFCATPGDLEPERRIFYEVAGQVNEAEGMPHGVLLVPVAVEPRMVNKAMFQPVVDANVRACRFFVQVLADTWGPPQRNFRREFELARELGLPMAVFFRRTAPAEPEIAALRAELGGGAFEYDSPEDFGRQLRGVLSGWLG
jgi:hypothetical protein